MNKAKKIGDTANVFALESNLRILFVTYRHPLQVGGMQRLSCLLTTGAKKLVPNVGVIAWGLPTWLVPIFWIYALAACVVYLAWHKFRHRYVVVHLCDPLLAPFGVLLKWLFHIPVAVTVHGLDIMYETLIYQKLFVGSLQHMDLLMCISRATMQRCLAKQLPKEKLVVIPVGIVDSPSPHCVEPHDSGISLPPKVRQTFTRGQIILTVGRMVERKGVHFFIAEVLPLVLAVKSDVFYVVAGDGPWRGEVEKSIRTSRLEDKVLLLGQVNERTKTYLYQEAAIFVMPNVPVKGDMEGFGIVALEASQHAACIIAADLEGIRDAIIDNENGFLVEAGNAESFAVRIIQLLADEQMRTEFGRKAQEFTRNNYGTSTMVERYLRALAAL